MQRANVSLVIEDIGVETPLIYDSTLPTVKYKLVGRNTTDVLNNKTISSSTNNIPAQTPAYIGIFGNGADGDLTVTTSIIAGSDQYFNNLTIDGGTFNTRNNRIFIRGKLTLMNGGLMINDGPSASGSTAGSSVGNATSHPLAPVIAGGGGTTTNGQPGGSIPNNRIGGLGGAGGNGSSGSGGVSGGGGIITQANGGVRIFNAVPYILNGRGLDNAKVYGGSGGGGGAGNGTLAGGGGGSGGGCVIVCANQIINGGGGGRISANGGTGAAGLGSGCGGGGGGGGGFVNVIASSIDQGITIEAKGGTGGLGNGSGINGVNGADGSVYILYVN